MNTFGKIKALKTKKIQAYKKMIDAKGTIAEVATFNVWNGICEEISYLEGLI